MAPSETDHQGAEKSADDLPHCGEKVELSGHSSTKKTLLDLPYDVLSRIFSNFEPAPELCMLMEVCTKFANVGKNPELWVGVKAVDPITSRSKEYGLHSAAKSIVYGSDEALSPPCLKNTKTSTARRRRRGAGLAVDIITSRAGSKLISLDMSDCYPNFPRYEHQLTDDDLQTIADRCSKSLEVLRLSASSFVSDTALADLARSCQRLRILHLVGFPNISGTALGNITDACPTLEDISVRRCPSFNGRTMRKRLIPVRSTLKRIDISETNSTSLNMNAFMTKCPAIEEINASKCKLLQIRLRPDALQDTPVSPRIKLLNFDNIHGIDTELIMLIWQMCRKLEHFSCNESNLGGDSDMEELFSLSTWPPLKTFNMARLKVTDEMFQRIFEMLGETLVTCDLSENWELSCKLRLFRNDSFAKLQNLRLRYTQATPDTVKTLISISPKLKSLDLSGCVKIDRQMRKNPFALKEVA